MLDYGDIVNTNASTSTLKHLDSVHHDWFQAARFFASYVGKVGWCSMLSHRDQHCMMFIYKAPLQRFPACICSFIELTYSVRLWEYLNTLVVMRNQNPLVCSQFCTERTMSGLKVFINKMHGFIWSAGAVADVGSRWLSWMVDILVLYLQKTNILSLKHSLCVCFQLPECLN